MKHKSETSAGAFVILNYVVLCFFYIFDILILMFPRELN